MIRYLLSITFSLAIMAVVIFTACERDPDPRPAFSRADTYSPSAAATDDTVYITGAELVGTEVRLNGKLVELEVETANLIGFIVKDDMESGTLELQLPSAGGVTGELKRFNNVLINELVETGSSWDGYFYDEQTFANGEVLRGPKILMISDFDGSGVRRASSTSTFSNVFWESNAAAAASVGIGRRNVSSSPSGGNFMYGTIEEGGILRRTNGFVCEFATRSETMNDAISPWPENFVDYPGSVLPQNFDIDELYLNFYVNNNGYDQSNLRIYIYNDGMFLANRFVLDFPILESEEGWHWRSLPINEFRSNFGFDDRITSDQFLQVNKMMFQLADIGSMEDAAGNQDESLYQGNPVQGYIDHIVLSYGAEMHEPVQRQQ